MPRFIEDEKTRSHEDEKTRRQEDEKTRSQDDSLLVDIHTVSPNIRYKKSFIRKILFLKMKDYKGLQIEILKNY